MRGFKINNKYYEIVQDDPRFKNSQGNLMPALVEVSPEEIKNRQSGVSAEEAVARGDIQVASPALLDQLRSQGVVVPQDISQVPQGQELALDQARGAKPPTTLGDVSGPTGSQLTKVPTNSVGPDGKPIFDVFAGTEHLTANDPRLKGVKIENLPTGKAPQGFTSQFGTFDTSSQPGGNSSVPGGNSTTVSGGIPSWSDPNTWSMLSDSQRAYFTALEQMKNSQVLANKTQASVNSQMLADALKLAQTDPTIKNLYGDAATLAAGELHSTLASLNDQYAQDFNLETQKQKQERKALAEQSAAAGQAYSGFRQQAEQQLAQQQSGVIQSSRRQLQDKLNTLGQGIETKYGASSPLLADIQGQGLAYNPMGLKGSVGDATTYGSQYQDILAKQKQTYDLQKLTT